MLEGKIPDGFTTRDAATLDRIRDKEQHIITDIVEYVKGAAHIFAPFSGMARSYKRSYTIEDDATAQEALDSLEQQIRKETDFNNGFSDSTKLGLGIYAVGLLICASTQQLDVMQYVVGTWGATTTTDILYHMMK